MSKTIDFKKDFKEERLLKEKVIEEKAPKFNFPKFTTQIINQASQNNQATRPKVVGQMSDLIQECPYNSFEGWKKWYLEKYPNAIDEATDKAYEGVENLRNAAALIDREMVKNWITDLVITKTAKGLIIQEAILKYISNIEKTTYRLATSNEEKKGIDGYIGNKPVQIKPVSYTYKQSLHEEFSVDIIYYKETKGSKYIKIYYKD